MNIPTIGGARGNFEIFVPGMFLLLNLGAVVYMLPFTDAETKNLITAVASNPALVLVIVVGFGYLIGVLLRLLRTDMPDQWSAAWLRRFDADASPKKGEFKSWAIEDFPYVGWIGETCKEYLPPDAQIFYDRVWAPRKRAGENKSFFNYCKVIINSNDERAANEIYVAESLTRYISGMFYALLFAFRLSGNSRGVGHIWGCSGKQPIALHIQVQALEEVGHVENSVAATFQHFNFVVEALHEATGVALFEVVEDLIPPVA